LVVLTLASIEFNHVDSTLIDLLRDVKNKLTALQKAQQKVQEEVQAGHEKIQKEVEEVQEEVQAMNNTIRVDDIKEKVDDINVKVDEILHHVSDTDGNRTLGTTTKQATTIKPTLEPGPSIYELKFVGGTSGASSTNSESDFPAKDAFVLNPRYGWLSKYNSIPAVIWYCFQEKYSPMKVSFRPISTDLNIANHYRAQKFEFVGRVKPGDSWEVICEGTGYHEYESMTEERGCEISTPIDRTFQCLGVRITQGTHGCGGLKGIRMWAGH